MELEGREELCSFGEKVDGDDRRRTGPAGSVVNPVEGDDRRREGPPDSVVHPVDGDERRRAASAPPLTDRGGEVEDEEDEEDDDTDDGPDIAVVVCSLASSDVAVHVAILGYC